MRVPRKSETSLTEDKYAALGFKLPPYLTNPYGIRIYTGTKGKEDWCVVIPKAIVQKKSCRCDRDVAMYCVTEEYALSLAEEFTRLAQQ